jgi:hypothetical protein
MLCGATWQVLWALAQIPIAWSEFCQLHIADAWRGGLIDEVINAGVALDMWTRSLRVSSRYL